MTDSGEVHETEAGSGVPRTASAVRHAEAVRTVREVAELLEALMDRGREGTPVEPVSPSQLRVLYALDRAAGINLRTLTTMLGSTPSAVSRMCDRLGALGYVERAPNPASRRELALQLTPRGTALIAGLRARRDVALDGVVGAMPEKQRRALLEGLRGLRAAVETPQARAVGRRPEPAGGSPAQP